MRYLTRRSALGALSRGNGIEQFLGGAEIDGEPAIRRVAISPMNKRYRISLDPVDEAYVGEGRELGLSEDEAEAISLAEHLTDARPDRWVNHTR
ncbi:hypothetical protein [Actinoplanes palleronii]|uniref:Uncharacterized protein n=1 Tax=Actinoplanes palleronii TaxID=113570 RepID=A0ABQ4BQV3_9ACTN|nr:hypothetical protein [Actinoplanes palleronii]GIE73039.1 hypothetical protein Apa02nite_091470 [Actinoplanes palleronii]